jgi:hypothetical protein
MYKLGGIGKKSHVSKSVPSRFIEPASSDNLPAHMVTWKNAFEAAAMVGDIPSGRRVYGILSGRFIFGDFIAALMKERGWVAEKMTISTLSISADNVGTLAAMASKGMVKQLDIIVSNYFFANERNGIIPVLYDALDKNDIFQLAVAAVHTKITLIKTVCGQHIVIHGSANLRTSDNIEQICIENSKELYDFNDVIHSSITEAYKTINKAVRGGNLWQAVLADSQSQVDQKRQQTEPQTQQENAQKERLAKAKFKAGI